jgi:glutaredoxin
MKAEVYSRDNCPYCVKAKQLLTNRNIEFEVIDATENRDTLIQRVIDATGEAPRTVPQIFLDGQYIGGYDQLVAHLG